MIKFYTKYKTVWLVGKEISVATPIDTHKYSKSYEVPSDKVAVVYADKERAFHLYIGRNAQENIVKQFILMTALQLEVTLLEIKGLETTRLLRKWDKFISTINDNLFASDRLFS